MRSFLYFFFKAAYSRPSCRYTVTDRHESTELTSSDIANNLAGISFCTCENFCARDILKNGIVGSEGGCVCYF